MEIWKPTRVEGYEVSSLGRVRSIDRDIVDKNGKRKRLKGRVLAQGLQGPDYLSGKGYLATNLGHGVHAAVHVLVCEAFRGPRPTPRHEVAHANGQTIDNRDFNVRWATKKENCADMALHGTRPAGERHGQSKLTDAERSEVQRLARSKKIRYAVIAADFGIHVQSVYRIGKRQDAEHRTA